MSLVHNVSIKTKFLIIPIVMAVFLSAVGWYFHGAMRAHYKELQEFVREDLLRPQYLFRVFSDISYVNENISRLVDDAGRLSSEELKKQMDQYQTNIGQMIKYFRGLTKTTYFSDKEAESIRNIDERLVAYQNDFVRLCGTLAEKGDVTESQKALKMDYVFVSNQIQVLRSQIVSKTQAAFFVLQADAQRSLRLFAFLSLLVVILTVTLGLLFARFLARPILAMSRIMTKITKSGDYSLRATKMTNDEFGGLVDGFNQMLFEIGRSDDFFRKKRYMLEDTLNAMSDMLIITNAKGMISFANAAVIAASGLVRQNLLNQHINNFLSYENEQPLDVRGLFLEKNEEGTESMLMTVAGDMALPVYAHHRVIKDHKGQKHAVLWTIERMAGD